MTELEAISTIIARAKAQAVAVEKRKVKIARERADNWKQKAHEYKTHMTRYQRELAEARSILRNSICIPR